MLLGLKAALLQRGLSQRELATLGGIAESRLSSLINGWVTPSPNERRRLAAALKQPEAALFDVNSTIEIRSAQR